ncbi:MAG: hypothetical protein COA74_02465 [Gammaproteobacteria bacterium]|nr:MAG: hypothetical protein COA74_02465 [Gammaproteobacteria bacterium]
MCSDYLFREATLDDLPLIFKWTKALMEHESLDAKLELPLTNNISELLEDWLRNLISDKNSLIIITTQSTETKPLGLIIGYLQVQPNNFTVFEMHGVIQMVWVDQEYRRKGLARLLVNHMEDTFQNLKVPYCEIQYSSSNVEAKAFWKKAGYEVTSVTCRKLFSKS